MYDNIIIPRQAPLPPGNDSEPIIYTDPDDVPMFMPLTPEQLAALPHPNYAPKLLVTIWVLLGLAGAFLALRLYCKFSRHRGTWWDDWFLVGSWVSSFPPRASVSFPGLEGVRSSNQRRETALPDRGVRLPHPRRELRLRPLLVRLVQGPGRRCRHDRPHQRRGLDDAHRRHLVQD